MEDLIAGNIDLVSKLELIKEFINKNLPKLEEGADIETTFEKYWKEKKTLALNAICEEEELDHQ